MPTVRKSPRERRLPGAKVAARERERLSGRGSLPARIAEGTIVAAAGVGVRELSRSNLSPEVKCPGVKLLRSKPPPRHFTLK